MIFIATLWLGLAFIASILFFGWSMVATLRDSEKGENFAFKGVTASAIFFLAGISLLLGGYWYVCVPELYIKDRFMEWIISAKNLSVGEISFGLVFFIVTTYIVKKVLRASEDENF